MGKENSNWRTDPRCWRMKLRYSDQGIWLLILEWSWYWKTLSGSLMIKLPVMARSSVRRFACRKQSQWKNIELGSASGRRVSRWLDFWKLCQIRYGMPRAIRLCIGRTVYTIAVPARPANLCGELSPSSRCSCFFCLPEFWFDLIGILLSRIVQLTVRFPRRVFSLTNSDGDQYPN